MNNEIRKNILKIVGVGFSLIVFLIIISVGTIRGAKTSMSVFNKQTTEFNLTKEGIKEEEFKKYLSVFAILAKEYNGYDISSDAERDDIRKMDSAVLFLDSLDETYTPNYNEGGQSEYDAALINSIVEEINGVKINGNISNNKFYSFDEAKNVYVKIGGEQLVCAKIDSIDSFEKKGNKIDVVYTCNYGENDVYKIKAVLVVNEAYDNSKYYVNEIEKMK